MTFYATKFFGEVHIFHLDEDEPMIAASRALKIWQCLYELSKEDAELIVCGRLEESFTLTVTPMETTIVEVQ